MSQWGMGWGGVCRLEGPYSTGLLNRVGSGGRCAASQSQSKPAAQKVGLESWELARPED